MKNRNIVINKPQFLKEEQIKSKLLFDNLTANIPVGIYTLRTLPNNSFVFEYASPPFLAMLNLNYAQLECNETNIQFVLALIHPNDLQEIIHIYKHSAENNKQINWTGRIKINIDYQWVNLIANPILQQNGEVVWNGLLTDITAQKQNEEELIETQQKFKLLLNSTAEGIYGVDINGNCTFINAAGLKMLGFSEHEIIGKHIHTLIHHTKLDGSSYPSNECKMYNALTNPLGVHVIDECFWNIKGTSFPVEYWSYPMYINGKIAGAVASFYDITKRKKAEKALFQSEAFLKETQVIASLGTYILNINKNNWYSSEVLNSIFGIDESFEKTFESWSSIIHQDWKEIMIDYFNTEVICNKKDFDKEYKIIRQNDKVERWVHGKGKLVFNKTNNPIEMIGTIQDITERKNAEYENKLAKEKAEESENKLKVLVNAMPDLVWFKNANGVYLECNHRFENFIGISQEQVLGKTDYDLFDKELADFFRANDKAAIDAGKPTINEETITFANDGHIEQLETIKTPIYDLNGKLIGVLGIGRNITAHKKAETEKENNLSTIRKLSEAISQSPVTTVITDLNGSIIFVNPKFTETTGYTFQEAIGQNPRILNTGFTSKSKYKDLWQTILSGNSWHGEFKNKKKNGELYWEKAIISPVKNDNGEITNFLAVKEDITEQKKAEELFQKNVRELEDYKFAIDESSIVSIANKEGIITYANNNFCKISKYSIDELIGSNHRIVNSNYHDKAYFEKMWNLIINGKVWVGELRNKAKDGSLYWVHGTIIPFLDENNKPFQFLSIRFDITKQKMAEEKILQSNERYNLVAKATNDSIWDLNILTNKIDRFGSGFEILFGYKVTDDNIDYLHYKNLIHPDDLNRIIASKTKVFNNPNEHNWSDDYRFLKANGDYAFVHDKGFIIRDKNGVAMRMIGATQDVTEREKHVKAIEDQNSKLRDIAWLQSHVVRAPLSRMMGIVNLLKDVELNGDEFKLWVEYFVKSSAELDKVIHDISNKSDEFDLKFKK